MKKIVQCWQIYWNMFFSFERFMSSHNYFNIIFDLRLGDFIPFLFL